MNGTLINGWSGQELEYQAPEHCLIVDGRFVFPPENQNVDNVHNDDTDEESMYNYVRMLPERQQFQHEAFRSVLCFLDQGRQRLEELQTRAHEIIHKLNGKWKGLPEDAKTMINKLKSIHLDLDLISQPNHHHHTLFDVLEMKEKILENSFQYVQLALDQHNRDYTAQSTTIQNFVREHSDKRLELDEQSFHSIHAVDLSEVGPLMERLNDLKRQVATASEEAEEENAQSEEEQQTHGEWELIMDYTDKKQAETQLHSELNELTDQIKTLLSQKMDVYAQFQGYFMMSVRPFVDLAMQLKNLEMQYGHELELLEEHAHDYDTRIDQFLAFTQLPATYEACAEEVNRRILFKSDDYEKKIETMNVMLEAAQREENEKRESFFNQYFESTEKHKVLISSILVEKLMPCLRKANLVPKLDNIVKCQFDRTLPTERNSGLWLITGDSQILSDNSPFSGDISQQESDGTCDDIDDDDINFDDYSDTDSTISLKPKDEAIYHLLSSKDAEIASLKRSIRTITTTTTISDPSSNYTSLSMENEQREELQERVSELERQLVEREEQQCQTSENIMAQQSTIKEQTETIRKLQKEVDLANEAQSEMESKIAKYDEIVSDLNQQIIDKNSGVQSHQKEIAKLTSEIEQLQTTSAAERISKINEIKTLKNQMMQFTSVIEDLRTKYQSADECLKELSTTEEELLDKLRKSEARKSEIQELLDTADGSRATLEKQASDAQQEIQSLRKQVSNLEETLQDTLLSTQESKEKDIKNALEKQSSVHQEELKNMRTQFLQKEKQLQGKHTQMQMEHSQSHAQDLERLKKMKYTNESLQKDAEQMEHALQKKIEELQGQLSNATVKNEKVLAMNEKLLMLISDKGKLKPNEVKIAIKDFERDDIVIFCRKRSKTGEEDFEIFNQNCPNFYLSPDAVKELKKLPQWKGLAFVRVRILDIEDIKADHRRNPFNLPLGTQFHVVHPYPFENSHSYEC